MGFITLVVLGVVIGGAVMFAKRREVRGVAPSYGSYGSHGAPEGPYDVGVDAAAEAHRWVERLGGAISTLDAGSDRAARQCLADAAERHRAAQGQSATAYSPAQYALVTRTALEGLHHVRAARTALGLDPGPALPAANEEVASGGEVRVGGRTYSASAVPGADTPYYHPGGVVGGRAVPGGWYSAPWWKTAAVAGAAGVGGMLLADVLLDGFHHHPHGPGGGAGPGGFGGPGGF
ncbi:hypothetical protein ABZX85_26015 [Streptomyces sp. NPDC004539]|uniref:hypothetical protein n=1 Tax=Streptomyces sp. NPDC004539 TaxID=3154280 RepID=UPI0033ADF33D